jgi:integrase
LHSHAAGGLCQLKTSDIGSQPMMVRINQGKGGWDREVPLSPTLLKTLRVYCRSMKPQTYLFPRNGQRLARRRAHQAETPST